MTDNQSRLEKVVLLYKNKKIKTDISEIEVNVKTTFGAGKRISVSLKNYLSNNKGFFNFFNEGESFDLQCILTVGLTTIKGCQISKYNLKDSGNAIFCEELEIEALNIEYGDGKPKMETFIFR